MPSPQLLTTSGSIKIREVLVLKGCFQASDRDAQASEQLVPSAPSRQTVAVGAAAVGGTAAAAAPASGWAVLQVCPKTKNCCCFDQPLAASYLLCPDKAHKLHSHVKQQKT